MKRKPTVRKAQLTRKLIAIMRDPPETVPTQPMGITDSGIIEDTKSDWVYNDRIDNGQPLEAN